MTFSSYGKPQWMTILLVSLALIVAAVVFKLWWAVAVVVVLMLALLSFFRDPERKTPTHKHVMVSPADGRVSSIHRLEHYAPFDGPALCIRIFLSVADVHVNRSPCHGYVSAITYKPGEFLNALNPKSAEVNESNLIVLVHPIKRVPVATVRQVAGLIARTIVCGARVGDTLQRGQRLGMIKFGSTTELYIPISSKPQPAVQQGQYVWGGLTVLAQIQPGAGADVDE